MAEFYVNQKANSEQFHLVHDKDCKTIEAKEEIKYLGSFSTAEAAFKKAKGFYDPVDYCSDCLKH